MLFKQNSRPEQSARVDQNTRVDHNTRTDQTAPIGQATKAPDDHPAPGSELKEQRLFRTEDDRPRGSDRNPNNESGGNVLIVGEGIRLKGEITACDRLVVEGHVEVSLNETRAVEIRPSGHFIGSCEVEEAEISGVYEGELDVRQRLIVHASGRATGKIRYGEIELERGGRIAGELSVRDPAKAVAAKMVETVQAQKPTPAQPGQKVA